MTEAINASDVLNAQELDAVSGGFMRLPLVAVKVLEIKGGGTGGGGGGQNDPAQMFQQILQQLTQQG
ncbi:hypothetical protein [Bradyrhizobium sp. JYMT SZCCT0428]|uniref:hypothetical protein n=1 Tax=Bradyrhizobium sp. JYMT SZCCT0428 TaxID=2807673 RepID=UPI001BA90BD1|nr:hypothetical protein [Bradyrhizobium sp. JYMT SZCCT0428]MBR1156447.1 hypothetical protein [Bradyrhizobium sp. JYMT SZCCT0428]